MDKKYIDVDKLMEFANNQIGGIDSNVIARFPKADVVEVVRCRDCMYLLKDLSERQAHICMWTPFYRTVEFDDFCSFGARKGRR